jgi:virulence-associated protein VapD
MSNTFCYHEDYRIADSYSADTYADFVSFHNSRTHLLNPAYKLDNNNYPDECEGDTDWDRGLLRKPHIITWLSVFCPEKINRLSNNILPTTDQHILVISWMSTYNLTYEHMDLIFNQFKGHVIIDDTFEANIFRICVYREWLESLGYDISNVSFWTNAPNKDQSLDFDKNIFRHNWLQLCEYGKYKNNHVRNRITDIDDVTKLHQYTNKKYKALYLNGHSTAQREYLISLFAKTNQLDNFLYSFVDVICFFKPFFEAASDVDRASIIPKLLPDETTSGRTILDRFKQDWWWQESFYNINVETNFTWYDNKSVMLTEKWMKSIMYLTPSFNIGDYHGYEKFQQDLGFNIYENYMDKSYDSVEDWEERNKAFVQCVQNTDTPSEAAWREMMVIAQTNANIFHDEYIPGLVNLFEEIINQITG